MKLTAALSYLLVVLPVLVSATAIADSSSLVARQNGGRQFGRQGNVRPLYFAASILVLAQCSRIGEADSRT